MSALVQKGLKAKRESKYIDFKQSFDPQSDGEWCELIKDIVAMANSGGGAILVGLDNVGKPSGEDVSTVLEIDHATFIDKIQKYTIQEFPELQIRDAEKEGQRVAIIEIFGVEVPMIFGKVGTYQVTSKKQKVAFSRGTIYFRHGAKSEPGTTNDLNKVIKRNVDIARKEWLSGVQKVMKAPAGSTVAVFKGEVTESAKSGAIPIKLVDDPDAPEYRLIDHDSTYPHRQKELVDVVNAKLPTSVAINSYDILSIRQVHRIDTDKRYFHRPKFTSPQYSDAFADWIVDKHKKDPDFFETTRSQYYDRTHNI